MRDLLAGGVCGMLLPEEPVLLSSSVVPLNVTPASAGLRLVAAVWNDMGWWVAFGAGCRGALSLGGGTAGGLEAAASA